jgi:hypothetical protein
MVSQNRGQLFLVLWLYSMSTVPSGNSPNASSNGANTVKGPSELKVPRSAAVTAATKV